MMYAYHQFLSLFRGLATSHQYLMPCRKKANSLTVLNLRLINHFQSLAVYVSIDLSSINLSTEWKLGSSQCPEPHRPMLKYFLDHQVNRNAYPKLNCIYPLVLLMRDEVEELSAAQLVKLRHRWPDPIRKAQLPCKEDMGQKVAVWKLGAINIFYVFIVESSIRIYPSSCDLYSRY